MKRAFILLAMPLLWQACDQARQPEETVAEVPAETAQPAEPVAEEPPTGSEVSGPLSLNGVIMIPPGQHATVTLTMGGSIESTTLLPGDHVEQGAVIATLRNPEFIDLQQAYLEAKAQSAFLEREYERQRTLASREAASLKRLQQSEADYLSTRSRLEAAAAQLAILGVDPKALESQGIRPYLEIKAPLGGYITNMNINVGKYIDAGEPVCDVINKRAPLLRLTAYEKDLSRLRVGDRLEFRGNGISDTAFEATLISIDQKVDEDSRSINVYARVEKADPRFRPGMYVNAKIREKP